MRYFCLASLFLLPACVSDAPVTSDSGVPDTGSPDTMTTADTGSTGDGGADSGIPMLDKSDLAFWFVAKPANVVMMGASVVKWADSSSKANDLSSSAVAPKYATDGIGKGRDAILFDEESPMVFKADPFVAFQSGYTMFLVISSNLTHDGYWIWGASDQQASSHLFGMGVINPDGGVGAWGINVYTATTTASGHESAKLKIYSVIGQLGSTQLYVDGTIAGTGALAMPAAVGRTANFIGGHVEGGKPREPSPGYYAEIIGYSRALSPGQHKAVIDYLGANWK